MAEAEQFEQERGRLVGIATRILDDRHEAEDIVQRAWLRLNDNTGVIENLPGWLTTVTTRLCIDRLRARVPVPLDHATHEATQDRNTTTDGTGTGANAVAHDPARHGSSPPGRARRSPARSRAVPSPTSRSSMRSWRLHAAATWCDSWRSSPRVRV